MLQVNHKASGRPGVPLGFLKESIKIMRKMLSFGYWEIQCISPRVK